MSAAQMIEVSNLSKWYGDHLAVDDVSFSVGAGEVVGFLGPNGAGKSTTLRVLTGYLKPSAGNIRVANHDVLLDPLSAREALGYMPETCPLYPELRVEEYLTFRARLKHVKSGNRKTFVKESMRRAGIYDRRGMLIGQLSKGLRQRVGLADALVSRPPLLILDEPTAGLDPNQIREVRGLIAELKAHHTVFLSTHILQEVEMMCDRAIVLSRGRVVGQGTLAELRHAGRQSRAELVLGTEDEQGLERAWTELAAVLTRESTERGANRLRCVVQLKHPELTLARTIDVLARHKVAIHEARLLQTRLEDVFAELTQEKPPDE